MNMCQIFKWNFFGYTESTYLEHCEYRTKFPVLGWFFRIQWGLEYRTFKFRTHLKCEIFRDWFWNGWEFATRTNHLKMELVHKSRRGHPKRSQPVNNRTALSAQNLNVWKCYKKQLFSIGKHCCDVTFVQPVETGLNNFVEM